MKLIRTLFLLALACGDPATVVEQPQAQGGSGTALPPAPGLEDAAPPVAYDPPPPVLQPDAGPAPMDEPDAAPPVVIVEPDAGVEPPVLIPGSSNVFCACVEVVDQVVDCTPPTVTCQGQGGIDSSATAFEQVYWDVETRNLELQYLPVVSTQVTTELQDVCPLQLPFTYVETYPLDNYQPREGLTCFVNSINCSVTETLSRSCV